MTLSVPYVMPCIVWVFSSTETFLNITLKTNKTNRVMEHKCKANEQKKNHCCPPFHMSELQAGLSFDLMLYGLNTLPSSDVERRDCSPIRC
jgi:hypothetical protein